MHFKKLLSLFLFLFSCLFSAQAFAQIKVVATLPELAWAAKEIGGDEVEAESLLSGSEDPHYVDASPAYVFRVAKADLLALNGLELEAGWLPKVLQMSGRKVVQPGEKGYCDASEKVAKLETALDYDRSKGDIHPAGNPHYTLSAKAMIQAGEKLKECLQALGAKGVEERFESYKKKLSALHERQAAKLAPLKEKKFMVYHREFSYFLNDFGIQVAGTLEEVPGVLPSAAYLSRVAALAKREGAALALASSVSPRKYLDKFKELSQVDYLMLQIHSERGQSYEEFFENLASEVAKHAK